MVDTLLHHGTDVQGNVGQGVSTSKVGPSHSKNPYIDHTGDTECSVRHATLHACTSCGGICYGPALDFRDNGLFRFVSKTHYFHIVFCFISQFSIVSQFISI